MEMFELSPLLLLGIVSGVLQLIGYWFYLRDDEIEPNPVSWFMFAYGTALLVVLEWDKEATTPELILPIICAILSVAVSVKCWFKSRKVNPHLWWPNDWWPDDFWEKWSFISDIVITIAYITAWIFTFATFITPETRQFAAFMFLFLTNLSSFPSFYPIINSTYKEPTKENPLPWMIWGIAYVLLGYITYTTHGEFWNILMFYPVSCAVLHILVGILAMRKNKST